MFPGESHLHYNNGFHRVHVLWIGCCLSLVREREVDLHKVQRAEMA